MVLVTVVRFAVDTASQSPVRRDRMEEHSGPAKSGESSENAARNPDALVVFHFVVRSLHQTGRLTRCGDAATIRRET